MPRNSSGTYSLPAGNPVISNTLIETNWANPTMADIGQALTESLDRYGRGGMLAPFRLADGTVTAPALSFASETSTGIYRTTAGTWNLSILGVNIFAGTSTGVQIVPPVSMAGTLGVTGVATFTAGATFNGPALRPADPATADELTRKLYVDNAISAATGGGLTYVKRAGDTMSGALQITANGAALRVFSGSASVSALQGMGRTANEVFFGVAGGPSSILSGDVAGDFCLTNNLGAIRLGLGTTAQLSITAAAGTIVGSSFSGVGPIIPFTLIPSISLGTLSGFPGMVLYNAGAGGDNKRWDQYANATTLVHRVVNDAISNSNSWLEVSRSGVNITSVSFPNGPGLGVGGNPTNYGGDIKSISVNATGQAVYDLHIAGVRAGTFTVAAGAGTAVILGSLGARPVELVTNTAVRMHISGGGLVGIGRTPVTGQLEVAGGVYAFGSEAFRAVSDSGYVSWYNGANTWRLGYLQYQVGGTALLVNEVAGGYFQFNLVGAPGALTVNTAGAYVGPGEPFRLTRVNEFSATANAAAFPGARIRYGRVAAVVSTGGTITFASPFATLYACVANVEGANGGGWIFRYHSANVNGFTYTWDQYNTAGGGAACFVSYYAIGV